MWKLLAPGIGLGDLLTPGSIFTKDIMSTDGKTNMVTADQYHKIVA